MFQFPHPTTHTTIDRIKDTYGCNSFYFRFTVYYVNGSFERHYVGFDEIPWC